MIVNAEDFHNLADGKFAGGVCCERAERAARRQRGRPMKERVITMALIAVLTGGSALGAPLPAPELRVDEALKIASAYLASHESGKHHFISALRLERASLLRKDLYWSVEWTPAIDVGNFSETGLRISMDGTVKRVVEPPAGGGRAPRVASPAR